METEKHGWLTVHYHPAKDGVRLAFEVNKWHPGYWWFTARTILGMKLYRIAPWLWREDEL